jgi:hypothetical protein
MSPEGRRVRKLDRAANRANRHARPNLCTLRARRTPARRHRRRGPPQRAVQARPRQRQLARRPAHPTPGPLPRHPDHSRFPTPTGLFACSRCAATRRLGSLDRGDDARATQLRAAADLLDDFGRGCLEEMEARLVVRQKRRADVADRHALAGELFGCGAGAASGGTRLVSARPWQVHLDEVARHVTSPAEGGSDPPSALRIWPRSRSCLGSGRRFASVHRRGESEP